MRSSRCGLSTTSGAVRPERRRFLEAVFGAAKKGRLLYRLDPADVASKSAPRESACCARCTTSKSTVRLSCGPLTCASASAASTTAPPIRPPCSPRFEERFQRREQQDIARIQHVLALVEQPGCQTAALVAHFGEELPGPCGHCTFCTSALAVRLPAIAAGQPIAAQLDVSGLPSCAVPTRTPLGNARQQARFLCGLTSPAAAGRG